MRMPIDLHLVLFESDAVFDIEIRDDYPGPRTILTVNGWHCDYFPSITLDRAYETAARL